MRGPDLEEIAARLVASVVLVRSGEGPSSGGGAGIAWRSAGTIATSAHVVMRRLVSVVLPSGREVPGEVVRRDVRRDLAVVRAPLASLPAVEIGKPEALRPGALVFALGHPLGVRDAVSAGVLQATGHLPPGFGLPMPQRSLRWVQADVRLAPGNSGGPLADADGRVLGICAMIVSGLALAVPSSEVEAFVTGAERYAA